MENQQQISTGVNPQGGQQDAGNTISLKDIVFIVINKIKSKFIITFFCVFNSLKKLFQNLFCHQTYYGAK